MELGEATSVFETLRQTFSRVAEGSAGQELTACTELLAKPRGVDGRCRGWDACDDRCVEARCGERPDQCFWIHPLGSGDVMQLWARSAAARELRRALMQARACASQQASQSSVHSGAGSAAKRQRVVETIDSYVESGGYGA